MGITNTLSPTSTTRMGVMFEHDVQKPGKAAGVTTELVKVVCNLKPQESCIQRIRPGHEFRVLRSDFTFTGGFVVNHLQAAVGQPKPKGDYALTMENRHDQDIVSTYWVPKAQDSNTGLKTNELKGGEGWFTIGAYGHKFEMAKDREPQFSVRVEKKKQDEL